MQLSASTRTIAGRRVVALDGVADLSSVPALQDELRREITRAEGHVVLVDIDGLVALDDVALGVLLGMAALARESGGDLEVVTGSARWRGRFASTGFDRAVTIRSSIT